MIATVSGEINQVLDGQVVVNVGGIGLLINVTEDYFLACHPGQKKAFHTYLVVREDLLALYGFETAEERELFVHLISVAGVGPKIALAALSALSPEAVRRAIAGDQPEVFARVSGIGKKTAQKIILDLQGKVQPMEPPGSCFTHGRCRCRSDGSSNRPGLLHCGSASCAAIPG